MIEAQSHNSIIPIIRVKKLRLRQVRDLAKITKDEGGDVACIHSVCSQARQAA